MKYLKRAEINTEKWDACVNQSENPLIYGISWFLDAATDGKWDGVVWGDYDIVLPLPWNKKTGFKQVYTPLAIQQMGLFGEKRLVGQVSSDIDLVFNKYIQVNYATNEYGLPSKLNSIQLPNLIVKLDDDYDKNYQNYSRLIKRSIRKGKEVSVEEISEDIFFPFFKRMFKKIEDLKIDFKTLEKVFYVCRQNNCLINYGAYYKGDLISVLAGYSYKNRITLVYLANTQLSYDFGAYPVMVDYIIKTNSANQAIIDFRGSSVQSIYDFNRRFGATPETYYLYTKENQLLKGIKTMLGK